MLASLIALAMHWVALSGAVRSRTYHSVVGARAASVRADGARPHGEDALPGWYRTAGAASWRFLAIVAAAGAVVYALVYLRVVVLPIIVALLASTLLLPSCAG